MPLALRETERALKDKKYDREKKFKWSKLALDKEFGTDDSKNPVSPPMINFTAIQQTIYQELIKQDDDVIEIKKENN